MKRLPYLDGWRAVSVCFVIISHLVRSFDTLGRAGVLLFFTISGYVITKTLLAERATRGTISLPRFYFRRACRILPPLLIFLSTTGLLGLATRSDILASAAFLCNVGRAECARVVAHTWSLAFEEQFYLLLPPLLAASLDRRRPHVAIAFAMGFFALPLVYPVWWIGRVGFAQTYIALLLGCFCAFREIRPSALVGGAAIVAILVAGVFAPTTASALLFPVATAAAIFSVRIFTWPVLTYLGRISYSVYLWQQLAMEWPTSTGFKIAALAGVIGIAALSFHTVERYFIGLARRTPAHLMPEYPDAEHQTIA